jgi:hypothetical protein
MFRAVPDGLIDTAGIRLRDDSGATLGHRRSRAGSGGLADQSVHHRLRIRDGAQSRIDGTARPPYPGDRAPIRTILESERSGDGCRPHRGSASCSPRSRCFRVMPVAGCGPATHAMTGMALIWSSSRDRLGPSGTVTRAGNVAAASPRSRPRVSVRSNRICSTARIILEVASTGGCGFAPVERREKHAG